MPNTVDPWWDALRLQLEELLVLIDAKDAKDAPEAPLIAAHVSTALDFVNTQLRRRAPPS